MNEIIFNEIDRNAWCEIRYLDNIIDKLNNRLSDYSIVVTPYLQNLPETKYKKILIVTGDEQGNLGLNPYQNMDVFAIFRIFNRIGKFDEKYVFPIPPGYNCTMHDDNSKRMVKMYPEKKLSERKYDIFYSGQQLPWRQTLVDNLNSMSNKFNILSRVNNSFRTGLHIDDYYKLLGDTKIALAPDGTSIDTFRYVEAFGSGCIVISTPKDNIWYYKDSPVFLINNWSELNERLIRNILSMDIDDIYYNNLKYYNDKLSEDAVANYIINNIVKC